MSYTSKYTGQEIDNKLDSLNTINNDISNLNTNLDTALSNLNKKANSSDYKIKTYTDPTIFGLSYDTMTMQDIVDVLPNDTILTFWVNGNCPNIYNSVCEGLGSADGYGNIMFKKITDIVRIEFEQYKTNTTLVHNYTTVNNVGWSANGWGLNTLYPIGAIYMSVNSTSPASIFGGDWEKIEGRFLFASNSNYPVGDVGGETRHTLTTNEIPSHMHNGYVDFVNVGYSASRIGEWTTPLAHTGFNQSDVGRVTGYTGGSESHNNMPPYLVVNMWKRIN